MTTTHARRHRITRRAIENKALATLRTKLTVRLLEYLYPFRGLNYEPYTREIVDKWIYAFHAPSTLVAEIYAAADGWLRMVRPGKEDDVSKHANRIPHRDGDGLFAVPKETELYYFFLSPIQLSAGAISAIQDAYRSQDNRPGQHQEFTLLGKTLPVQVDGEQYFYYPQSGSLEVNKVVTTHTYKDRDPYKLYAVLIKDPYAWADDIQFMGHLPSLELVDEYLKNNRLELEVAIGFQAMLEKDPEDKLDTRNDLADKNKWWNSTEEQGKTKLVRNKAHEFPLNKPHPHDSNRVMDRVSKVDPYAWAQAPTNAKDVVDLRLKMHELQLKAGLDLVAGFATELAEWMDGPRHRIVGQAAVDMGGDSLAISIFHIGFVTHRLDNTDPGKKWLNWNYKNEKDRFLAAFFKAIVKPDTLEDKWYKPVKKATNATMKVVKNFIGAMEVNEKDFEQVIKHTFCKQVFGLKWVAPDPKKVPRLWGKPILKEIPSGILVPEKSALGWVKEHFEKYRVSEWFEGVSLTFEAIDVCLILHKIMSEQAEGLEKAKAALETTGVAIKLVKFNVELNAATNARLAGLEAKEAEDAAEAAGKRLGGALSLLGVFTGFIEFHVAVTSGLKAYYMDGDYRVAALQGISAVAIGAGCITGGLGAAAALGVEAVTPVAGWIAAVITVGGFAIGWLASKLKRNKWEEVTAYSYLGQYCLIDDPPFLKYEYLSCNSNTFSKDLVSQQSAQIALFSGFKVEGASDKAIFGDIAVQPLFAQATTKFRIIWLFTHRRLLGGSWAYFEVRVDAEFTVDDFEVTSKCIPDTYTARIEHDVRTREDGSAESFTLSPRVVGMERIPEKTVVLVQCQPGLGLGLTVPLDTEEGPYHNFVHGSVGCVYGSFETSTEEASGG